MKTKIIRILALAAIMFSSALAAFGQEFIWEYNYSAICDTSIVRAKSNDSVILYNRTTVHSSFSLITSGLIPAPTMSLLNCFVNDFEIYDNRVYFCGYRYENGHKQAVLGSFHLSSFPNCQVTQQVLDTCTELKKLDVYKSGTEPETEIHLVMVGTTGTRSDAIVDKVVMTYFPYYTYNPCWAYFSDDDTENFDDVAVTNNYIVVSSRKRIQGYPIIDFWQFSKPSMTGTSIFFMPIHHLSLSSPTAETPVFLEHEAGDDYAAVYKNIGISQMFMLHLTAPNSLNNCVDILADYSVTVIPMDIKYNRKNKVYDILARSEFENNTLPPYRMQIYHVTSSVLDHTAPMGQGTKYSNDRLLWSIDPLVWSNNFLASGSDWYQHPRLFRYIPNIWKACSDPFDYVYDTGKPEIQLKETKLDSCWIYKLPSEKVIIEPQELPCYIKCEEK